MVIAPYFRSINSATIARRLVDVGAAYGSVAQVFLREGWTADLFEPDPACHQHLASALRHWSMSYRLFTVAVGAEDNDAALFHQNAVNGLSGFDPSPFGQLQHVLQVRSVRLDNFLHSQDVTRVDFLKIDTEGNDFEVLAAHDFERLPPALVFVEFSYYFPRQDPAKVKAGIEFMAERGYLPLIFEYEDDGNFMRGNWVHRLVAMHFDIKRLPQLPGRFGNILFYRSEDQHFTGMLTALLNQFS